MPDSENDVDMSMLMPKPKNTLQSGDPTILLASAFLILLVVGALLFYAANLVLTYTFSFLGTAAATGYGARKVYTYIYGSEADKTKEQAPQASSAQKSRQDKFLTIALVLTPFLSELLVSKARDDSRPESQKVKFFSESEFKNTEVGQLWYWIKEKFTGKQGISAITSPTPEQPKYLPAATNFEYSATITPVDKFLPSTALLQVFRANSKAESQTKTALTSEGRAV